MSKPLDPKFYSRADAFIHLANDQYKNNDVGRGEVCASFMYGAARFNAWLSARVRERRGDAKCERRDYRIICCAVQSNAR